MYNLRNHKTLLKFLNMASEFVIVFIAYWIATFLRYILPFGQRFSIMDSVRFMTIALMMSATVVLTAFLLDGYITFHINNVFRAAKNVFISTIFGIFTATAIIFSFRLYQFSRVMLGYCTILFFLFIFAKRIIVDKLADAYSKKYNVYTNVIMIGSGRAAHLAYDTIFKPGSYNMKYIGYLDDNPTGTDSSTVSENIDNNLTNTTSGDSSNHGGAPGSLPGYLGTVDDMREAVLNRDVSMILIADPDIYGEKLQKIVIFGSNYGIRVCIIPEYSEYMAARHAVNNVNGNYIFDLTAYNSCEIMGVNISVTNMEMTVNRIKSHLSDWSGKYICVSNVHTTVMASEDEEYKKVQNNAVMALPDGGPLSKFSRDVGFGSAKRVTGPDLMKEMLKESKDSHYRHYFYGSTKGTLDKLRTVIEKEYPGAVICGMMSPPFRELTVEEDMEVVSEINACNPDFIWVGLGAPKQEIWMASHENRVKGLMIGVGAAFDYESGNIKRAPKWMQKSNLEWVYRLLQDPKRLFYRYLYTNPKYLWWTYRHKNKE